MRRLVIIVLAAGTVALAVYAHYSGRAGARGEATLVPFTYSPNQEELLLPLIETFNRSSHLVGGRRIEIVGESLSSGDAESKIAARATKPAIWSPASSLWGRLLNHQVDAQWVGDRNAALVRTPLVIALWKPEAQALGWPRKPIGFATILELATSKRGWAAYGLPTYGLFKLGHTNPDFSTSGLSFVAAQYYNATGKRHGLTEADVRRADVRAKVRDLQQSIVHYGDTGSFFAEQLNAHGPGYISAVAMEEVTLLDYNRTRHKGSIPLVAVYPAEGTFYFDNPLITLHAPWVTPMQRRAATVFERWLASRITPQLAANYGYRPGDPSKQAVAPVDTAHLVDPKQPQAVLELPTPRVLATIKRAWREDRKAANIAVVVDTSGSMQEDGKLIEAEKGLQVFLRQLSPRDRVGLLTFAERVRVAVPVAPMSTNREPLLSAVRNLVADGGTAVYDATAKGVGLIAALGDTSRINAVVVLTDGEDNQSRLGVTALVKQLRGLTENPETSIRVFTIAYGSGPSRDVLARIAAASGGKDYAGDPAEIAAVYRQISSFF